MFFTQSNTSDIQQVFKLTYACSFVGRSPCVVSGFVYLWLYFHQENFSYSTNMQQCREV